MATKTADEDQGYDPKRLRRLEDHLREIVVILEQPKDDQESEIDRWFQKTKILISEV